jgi:hypothetical protein
MTLEHSCAHSIPRVPYLDATPDPRIHSDLVDCEIARRYPLANQVGLKKGTKHPIGRCVQRLCHANDGSRLAGPNHCFPLSLGRASFLRTSSMRLRPSCQKRS